MITYTRNTALDAFKLIAALLVIAVHCGFLFDYNKTTHHITCNSIFRISIPFFFCINGFYLYNIFQTKKIKTWIKRIAVLYIVWMLVFIYFWIVPVKFSPFKIVPILLFGFNHLWYLIALLLGGLLLYIFRNSSNTILIGMAILLYIIGYSLQLINDLNVFAENSMVGKFINFPPLHRNFLFFGFPFLSIGYVIKKTHLHIKQNKNNTILLLLTGFLFLIIESILNLNFNANGSYNMSMSFLMVGPSLLLYSFHFKPSTEINSKVLSSFSISLYLIHPLVIFFILNFFEIKATALTFLTILVSGLISYLVIQLNKKVKFIL